MSEIYTPKTFQQNYDAMEAWLIGRNSTLTNFVVGSRTRTVVEAVAFSVSRAEKDMYLALRAAIPISAIEGFKFTRKAGVASTGTIRFSRATVAGETYPIPAGTEVILESRAYRTDAAGEITIGNTESSDIAATAVDVGDSYDIPIGGIDTQNGSGAITNKPAGIQFAYNYDPFIGGQGEETDDARQVRFQSAVQGLARSPVQGLKAGALSVDGVRSVSVREHYPRAGWVTVYCDDGDGYLQAAIKTEVEKILNGDESDPDNYPGYRAGGIQVQVLAPDIVTVPWTVKIYYLTNTRSAPADLETEAENALKAYNNALEMGVDVVVASAVKAIMTASTDIVDVEITAPTANVVVAAGELAKAGAVSMTSQATSL